MFHSSQRGGGEASPAAAKARTSPPAPRTTTATPAHRPAMKSTRDKLRRELRQMEQTRTTQRAARHRAGIPSVAIAAVCIGLTAAATALLYDGRA